MNADGEVIFEELFETEAGKMMVFFEWLVGVGDGGDADSAELFSFEFFC